MRYRGRNIDPVALWSNYVDFPPNISAESDDMYLSKVVCPNPAHDTFKRHFQINARDGLVHCFARCGISGTFEHAISIIEGIPENEARKLILAHQRKGGYEKPPVRKKGVEAVAVVRPELLRYETFLPQVGLEYLAKRGITPQGIAAFGIGWCAEEKRIVIPAKDASGKLQFLIKRAVLPRQSPKYLYTEGFPKSSVLFGACQIDPGMVRSDGLVLVEGSIDVVRFHQFGFSNTGGILGSGISDQQRWIINRLRPPRIYLAFDKDSAGIYNVESAVRLLRKYPLFVCRFPKGKFDPADLSRREAHTTVEKAIPLAIFMRRLKDKGIALNFNRQREGAKVGY